MAEKAGEDIKEKGIVIKGVGGFYFVDTGTRVFRARGRGILKRNKSLIIVGDEVEAAPPVPGDDDGVIIRILPRKNSFSRPPVSNIDKIIVVFSLKDPEPNLEVIDRLLVMAEKKDIEPIVCINKLDLDDGETVERLKSVYEPIYPTVTTCCNSKSSEDDWENDYGFKELKKLISGYRVALAGPSGVGKSSLTNKIIPDAMMETGEISDKTSRGKHTTRHVEMIPLENGYIYDTPGFTSFDLVDIEENELQNYFPEIKAVSEKCKFRDCLHIKEPECCVLEQVREGKIAKSRYESYISSLNEIREKNRY